jgi:hypothetical protein
MDESVGCGSPRVQSQRTRRHAAETRIEGGTESPVRHRRIPPVSESSLVRSRGSRGSRRWRDGPASPPHRARPVSGRPRRLSDRHWTRYTGARAHGETVETSAPSQLPSGNPFGWYRRASRARRRCRGPPLPQPKRQALPLVLPTEVLGHESWTKERVGAPDEEPAQQEEAFDRRAVSICRRRP